MSYITTAQFEKSLEIFKKVWKKFPRAENLVPLSRYHYNRENLLHIIYFTNFDSTLLFSSFRCFALFCVQRTWNYLNKKCDFRLFEKQKSLKKQKRSEMVISEINRKGILTALIAAEKYRMLISENEPKSSKNNQKIDFFNNLHVSKCF